MLKIFPGNPYLHRALADLLIKRKSFSAAAEYYQSTADLFIADGVVLPAVVAKMLQWQIVKPSFKSIKEFYHSLIEKNPRMTPLNMFLASLSFREFIVFITRLDRITLPPRKVVKKFGDPENNLFMVVSGKLHKRTYPSASGSENATPVIESIEDEFFGDIFPLEKERFSQSYTETATKVELVKISRDNLLEICKDFPSIGAGLLELFENHGNLFSKPFVERKTRRHSIPVRVSLEVHEVDETAPRLKLQGYARDLSIGGACLILESGTKTLVEPSKLIGKTVNIIMSPPNDAMTLNIKGSVVWSQMITTDDEVSQALGIEFDAMSPNLSGLLLVFADNLYHAH